MSVFRGEPGRKVVVTAPLAAASVDTFIFIADRAYTVSAIREVHSVVGGSSAAVRVRTIQADAIAPGAAAGANVIELAAALDLTATANTVQTPVITTSSISKGDRLALDFSGTLTGLVGFIEVELEGV